MDSIGADIDLKDIKTFILFLKENYNYDFSEYALSSFKRRLQRLITITNSSGLSDVTNKIKSHPGFIEKVVQEITVNTTEMFRDPTFWRKLRDNIIPEILKISGNKIKIWHMASSSGEEVYSMCILLKELGILNQATLLATDINEEVIQTAIDGIYPKRSLEINNANYQRFHTNQEIDLQKHYQEYDINNIKYDPSLISNVTFKRFNLVNGTLPQKFDLILCRNVLIYFNMELQDRVVSLAEECLFSGAYFAVGSKETIAWCKSAQKFRTIDTEDKIYKKLV